MAKILLPCGRNFLIDESDVHVLSGKRYFSDKRGNTRYIRLRSRGERGGGKYLHNILMGGSCDHINGNGLDNRRCNLRRCTQSQNSCNSGKKRKHKRFKGVYYDTRRQKWWAQLYFSRKSFWGGYHNTEIEAVKAYNLLATQYHGDFARLNTIPSD
jgi:hypothetical protein